MLVRKSWGSRHWQPPLAEVWAHHPPNWVANGDETSIVKLGKFEHLFKSSRWSTIKSRTQKDGVSSRPTFSWGRCSAVPEAVDSTDPPRVGAGQGQGSRWKDFSINKYFKEKYNNGTLGKCISDIYSFLLPGKLYTQWWNAHLNKSLFPLLKYYFKQPEIIVQIAQIFDFNGYKNFTFY